MLRRRKSAVSHRAECHRAHSHLLISTLANRMRSMSADKIFEALASRPLKHESRALAKRHRKLVHDSYQCPRWLEYLLVYCGVQVGLTGPLGLLHQHDLRDYAQRIPGCHPYLRHGRSMWVDACGSHPFWWEISKQRRSGSTPVEPRGMLWVASTLTRLRLPRRRLGGFCGLQQGRIAM
jgi:hypothetical protein